MQSKGSEGRAAEKLVPAKGSPVRPVLLRIDLCESQCRRQGVETEREYEDRIEGHLLHSPPLEQRVSMQKHNKEEQRK